MELHFNGECCDHGISVLVAPPDTLESVQQRGLRLFKDRAPKALSAALYDEGGIVRSILDLRDGSNVWVVAGKTLFVWPSVRVGYSFRPSGIAQMGAPLELETPSFSP